jgi:hypothetical protein
VTAGGVAQLGERLLCKQEVIGSIPFTSTNEVHAREHRDVFWGLVFISLEFIRSLTIWKKQSALSCERLNAGL